MIATSAGKEGRCAVVETDYQAEGSAWIAARCVGGDNSFAHTSPVYLEAAGRPIRPGKMTLAPLLAALDRTLNWVEREADCETERQRQHLREVLASARQELLRRQG